MGIRGLFTFIDSKFRHWKSVDYKKKVIIDGNSIGCSLYKDISWALGGEYDKFASKVEEFFEQFPFHDPIVVLDGSKLGNSKDETVRERRIAAMVDLMQNQKPDTIHTDSEDARNLLPSLILTTFIATLEKLKIEYYIADGESDNDVAALADEHECPVLSADSDFFIFNLQWGFIHFGRLRSTAKPLYYVNDFIRQFRLGAHELCLMIPSYFGNDFIEAEVQEVRKRNFQSFMQTLSNSTTSNNFKRTQEGRKIRSSNYRKAMEFYSYLAVSTAYSDQPQLLHNKYKEGKFSTVLFDAFLKHTCLQPRMVESIESEAAWRASRPIRQQIYHMLQLEQVTEVIRENGKAQLIPEDVTPVSFNIPASIENVPLNAVLCSLLKTESIPDEFTRLDAKWKLPIAATCFWYKETSKPRLLLALLLSFLTLHENLARKAFSHPRIAKDMKPDYLEAFHAYSKWQCVYYDAISLNSLAVEPMCTTSPAELYSGEIAMGYALNVELLQAFTDSIMELLRIFWTIVAGTPFPASSFFC